MVGTYPAIAQTQPQFVLGFKVLHDMIPDIVGQPLENEHYNPLNGDSLQGTTNGLLVWRKADNFTAFTDGTTTWVNGPFGLQSRPNADRFPWEPATPPPPPAQPAPPAPAPSPTPMPVAPTQPRPAPPAPTAPHPDNWSGYVAARFATGQSYTSVAGNWTVPTVKAPPGQDAGFAATWIGIGGACLDAHCNSVDPTLIQMGTEYDAAHGSTEYLAWYEMLPDAAITISPLTISPGDKISANIKMVGGSAGSVQSWQLSMTNTTTGKSWTQTVKYQSALASADWIVEAPFSGQVLPLADFGTATIDPVTANGANPHLSPSQGIVMLNPNGQVGNVSPPDGEGDGFNVCFATPGQVPSCPVPAS